MPTFWSILQQGTDLAEKKGLFLCSQPWEGPGATFLACLFQVAEVYRQLHAAMSQEPVKENIPYSWASVAYVKAHHYVALAHYFAATLLIDHQRKAGARKGCGLAALGGC